MKTGIKEFDAMCGGGITKGLYVFAGPSGVGKTSLLVNIALNLALAGRHVIIVSQEMDGGGIAKMIYRCAGSNADADKAMDTMRSCRDKIAIYDKDASGGALDADGCVRLVDDWMQDHPGIKPVVMIDHFQRIASTGREDLRSGAVIAAKCLADYCRKEGLAVLCVSQVSGSYRLRSAAQMEPKESVDLAYESDFFVNMQLKEVNDAADQKWGCGGKTYDKALGKVKREIVFSAYKKRCSGPSMIVLTFDSANCRFEDAKREKKKQRELGLNPLAGDC